jgi:1-acyl-sn-glycerol-3-phosphate acyltransferase
MNQALHNSGPGADIERLLVARLPKGWHWLAPAARRVLGFDAAAAVLGELPPASPEAFVHDLLGSLRIDWQLDERVPLPADGPLIVAANHPLGLVDGLVLLDYIYETRNDVRLLANRQLAELPAIGSIVVPVIPRSMQAPSRAGGALGDADTHLKEGGSLLVFPAGAVARQRRGGIPADGSWRTGVARLAAFNRCPVLPIAVLGQNSATFYALGKLSQSAADSLLVREALGCRRAVIPLASGAPMNPPGTSEEDILTFTADLRFAVNALLLEMRRRGTSRGRGTVPNGAG